ncbi:MAG: hypothetical protein LUQ70_05000 [Methanobacteriaceae archaeon]|nr:hypothetical protein [Methanobacteriaceae archaeon]
MEKLTMGLIVMIILLGGFISYLGVTFESGNFTLNTTNLSSNDSSVITPKINTTRTITSPTQNTSTGNNTKPPVKPPTNNTNASSEN